MSGQFRLRGVRRAGLKEKGAYEFQPLLHGRSDVVVDDRWDALYAAAARKAAATWVSLCLHSTG